jgi:hypothetical protein
MTGRTSKRLKKKKEFESLFFHIIMIIIGLQVCIMEGIWEICPFETVSHINLFLRSEKMLRKILLVLVLVGIVAIVGCKKEEPVTPPETPAPTQEQQSAVDGLKEQAGAAADQAAQTAEGAKQEAGKQLEDAGKALQK